MLTAGRRGEAKMVVESGDTARALGSGDVDVLGTPRIIALFEQACCRAVAPDLPSGATTVGVKVRIDHLQPSPIGSTVRAEATVRKVEGRRISFTVSASDDRGLVAVGRATRVIVDLDRFMHRVG